MSTRDRPQRGKDLQTLAAVGLLLFAVWPWPALADGKAFYRSRDVTSFLPIEQREQRAAIVHRDGVQRMVIAINLELQREQEAVWIFPLPGTPADTTLDLVDSFPEFRGVNPFHQAKNCVTTLMTAARATQIYPFLIESFMESLGTAGGAYAVHTEVDRWGVHAETISVDSVDGLRAYLEARDRTIAVDQLEAFAPYLSDEYVLVVASISSREQLLEEFPRYRRGIHEGRWPCLYVEFATERAYYPMRPTGTYGDAYVPVTLIVTDYVMPQTAGGRPRWAYASHYWLADRPEQGPEQFTAALPEGRFAYTVVRTSGDAMDYTEDLWFDAVPAPDTTYADALASLSNLYVGVPAGILFIAGLSYVSAGLTGLLMFGQWKGYAAVGLWNVLTLPALGIAVEASTGRCGENMRRGWGKGWWRLEFWFVFTIVFMVVTITAHILLWWPL